MKDILVPEQVTGTRMDARSEASLDHVAEAIVFYKILKERLVDINRWDEICGTEATHFQLMLPDGRMANKLIVGNLIRIDIPGPATKAGTGYDWVQIEQVGCNSSAEVDEWTGFTVRPCKSPYHPDEGIAHFFTAAATSTFSIGRKNNIVWAEMNGRNEVPNCYTGRMLDSLRNEIVGLSAKLGFSFPQWKLLVEGLVARK